jgi:hypothetical protein
LIQNGGTSKSQINGGTINGTYQVYSDRTTSKLPPQLQATHNSPPYQASSITYQSNGVHSNKDLPHANQSTHTTNGTSTESYILPTPVSGNPGLSSSNTSASTQRAPIPYSHGPTSLLADTPSMTLNKPVSNGASPTPHLPSIQTLLPPGDTSGIPQPLALVTQHPPVTNENIPSAPLKLNSHQPQNLHINSMQQQQQHQGRTETTHIPPMISESDKP